MDVNLAFLILSLIQSFKNIEWHKVTESTELWLSRWCSSERYILNPARNILIPIPVFISCFLFYHFHKNGKTAIKIMKRVKGHRKYESDLEGRILTGNENERGDYLADEGGTGEWRPGGEKCMPLVQAGANAVCVCV